MNNEELSDRQLNERERELFIWLFKAASCPSVSFAGVARELLEGNAVGDTAAARFLRRAGIANRCISGKFWATRLGKIGQG